MITDYDTFVAVQWPEVQEFMDIPGFPENSVLINDSEALVNEYGSQAYLVRFSWYNGMIKKKAQWQGEAKANC